MPDERATALLLAWQGGDQSAFDRLVPIVHDELRRLAQRYMSRERPDHTLQATALVNEAYLRLIHLNRMNWQDRAHFLAMAARIMRRILVDFARARVNDKRGGGVQQLAIEDVPEVSAGPPHDLVALDDALDALAAVNVRQGQIVELKFFGGLTTEEAAEVLGISPATVKRDWQFAKLWLLRELASRG